MIDRADADILIQTHKRIQEITANLAKKYCVTY